MKEATNQPITTVLQAVQDTTALEIARGKFKKNQKAQAWNLSENVLFEIHISNQWVSDWSGDLIKFIEVVMNKI